MWIEEDLTPLSLGEPSVVFVAVEGIGATDAIRITTGVTASIATDIPGVSEARGISMLL